MYGLVNKGIRDLVIENAGEQAWVEIADACGVDHVFISIDSYDDEITYRLVTEAAERLGLPAEQILRDFGSYWIRYTATEGYGGLVDMFGETLPEFLRNLGEDLHGRVSVTMPHLRPPEFYTDEISPNHFEVHYKSHRAGLTPMVLGLLEGLAQRYEAQATISHNRTQSDSPVHEVFDVIVH